jgi:rRNA maturation endonuclease Nob1
MKGRHGHDYYKHMDLPQGCFYVKDEKGKTVCAICTSNSETLLNKTEELEDEKDWRFVV